MDSSHSANNNDNIPPPTLHYYDDNLLHDRIAPHDYVELEPQPSTSTQMITTNPTWMKITIFKKFPQPGQSTLTLVLYEKFIQLPI